MSGTTEKIQQYALYYTAATETHPVGYVWNRIAIGAKSVWEPPAGSAIVLDDPDPDTGAVKYLLGSTYAEDTSKSSDSSTT